MLLVALDWGLGHVTRCIPLINNLLAQENEVVLGGNEVAQKVWHQHFPQLEFVHFNGYNISYGKSRLGTIVKFLWQLPKINRAIKAEHAQLNILQAKAKFDYVISDNRLGLSNPNAKCIYITHQLIIKTPFAFTTKWLQKIHYKYIIQFNECWVPDHSTLTESLAGELSHPKTLPQIPVTYIGNLTSWPKLSHLAQQYECCIVLSGPEPQRSIFEQIVLKQLSNFKGKAALVRGLPNSSSDLRAPNNVTVFQYLPANDLVELVAKSGFIVCRAGYSTIMDLAQTKKPALLVPTPGQTEQEYLAKFLSKRPQFVFQQQHNLSLQKAQQIFASVYGADLHTV